jgi:hypothetical protein
MVEVKNDFGQGRDYSERGMKSLVLYYYCDKATDEVGSNSQFVLKAKSLEVYTSLHVGVENR